MPESKSIHISIRVDKEDFEAEMLLQVFRAAVLSMDRDMYANTKEEADILNGIIHNLEEDMKPKWRNIPHFEWYEMNENGDIREKGTESLLKIHTIPNRTDGDRWRVDLVHSHGVVTTRNWRELMVSTWGNRE